MSCPLNVAVTRLTFLARFVGRGAVSARQELFHKCKSVDFDFYGSKINLEFVDVYNLV